MTQQDQDCLQRLILASAIFDEIDAEENDREQNQPEFREKRMWSQDWLKARDQLDG